MTSHSTKVMTSSKRQDWRTPPDLFEKLNEVFHFGTDLFADDENHLCPRYFTKENSAWDNKWTGNCFANPEYGSTLKHTMARISTRVRTTSSLTVACLIPARVGSVYWMDHIWGSADYVLFLRGRVQFVGAKDVAPFNSAVVVYSPHLHICDYGISSLSKLGHLIAL